MAHTVSGAFDEFYDAINLSGDHREVANARRDRLVELLGKSFEVMEAFGIGSIPKFTALRGHADLDVLVALHWGKHIRGRRPVDVLQAVRDALGQYRTQVRKNGQAVTLYYETWPNVDIVPAAQSTSNGVVTHYQIPDSTKDAWLSTRPKQHAEAIEQRAGTCGPHFRKIIKMAKAWNIAHGGYLQSYHIEVLGLNALNGHLSDLPWDVFHFLENGERMVRNPLQHEGTWVDDYLSAFDRGDVVKRLEDAVITARSAWYEGAHGDQRTAIKLWGHVFGDKYPA